MQREESSDDSDDDRAYEFMTTATAGVDELAGLAAGTDASAAAPPSANPGHFFHFGANKAGMQNVDRERINRIIHEASKGSAYYDKALRTDAKLQLKIAELKQKVHALTDEERQFGEAACAHAVEALEKSRDLTQTWAVVDFDAFFAAVEERDFPHLRGKPMGIGLGLLSTANYEARKYGVRAAMPEFIARKLCPQLIVRALRGDAYAAVASKARVVYAKYDPNFLSYSQDEAYLNITAHLLANPTVSADDAVAALRRELCEETQLTASAGIACTPMLAKICADVNKPNGQFRLTSTREAVVDFLHALPIRRVPGIGKQTEALLAATFGAATMGDIWNARVAVQRVMAPLQFDFLLRASLGCTETDIVKPPFSDRESERKSISVERTFRGLSDRNEIEAKLRHICARLAEDVAQKQVYGRTVTLKYKTTAFDVHSKALSLSCLVGGPSAAAETFFNLVGPVLLALLPCEIRLLGVRLSALADAPASEAHLREPQGKQALLPDVFREQGQGALCPVCSCHVKASTNAELNAHIDQCLSAPLIREMAHAPSSSSSSLVAAHAGKRHRGSIEGFLVKMD